jgi:hypothetical protein
VTTAEPTGERLARIEEKLNAILTQMIGNDSRVELHITDHETRLRKLERALWIATGAGLVAGGSAGAIVAQLMGAG